MGRPKLDRELRPLVEQWLADAVKKSPKDRPISFNAIGKDLQSDPRTIKAHFSKEVRLARGDQQRGRAPSEREAERRGYAELLTARDAEIERLRGINLGLVARWALAEGNATRLGVDPEELLRPIAKPDRAVSRAGSRGFRGKRTE